MNIPAPCPDRKVAYVTLREARSFAGRTPSGRQIPYHCRYCALWHLTSKGRESRRHRLAKRRKGIA